ncbi:unnamed protein product [Paramecium octaurelia]|uniref:Dynein axonemal light chain 1 n=1 Tax=Paramecium octaurelia TaxID=43137 RepID=A0A8S1SN42_PAROT|nr:unnamed protein product [Paramecium octaurelia]
MAKTTCAKALQNWEQEHPGEQPSEAEDIRLIFQNPPLDKLDPPVLNTLAKVKRLSLSSNAIEKMVNLPGLRQIEILSLSRNNIKKIAGLEEIGQTLKELWLSYNYIERLDGLQPCVKLHTLYIGNNRIKIWDEVDKLKDLPEIANVLFVGNPIYENQKDDPKLLVLKRITTLKNVDGTVVDDSLMEKVKALGDGVPTTTVK